MRRRAIVTGRVQGVGMRMRCADEARRRGIGGWVRNLPDGTVETELEGSADALEGMLQWLRAGPPAARVDTVDVTEIEPAGTTDFEIR